MMMWLNHESFAIIHELMLLWQRDLVTSKMSSWYKDKFGKIFLLYICLHFMGWPSPYTGTMLSAFRMMSQITYYYLLTTSLCNLIVIVEMHKMYLCKTQYFVQFPCVNIL